MTICAVSPITVYVVHALQSVPAPNLPHLLRGQALDKDDTSLGAKTRTNDDTPWYLLAVGQISEQIDRQRRETHRQTSEQWDRPVTASFQLTEIRLPWLWSVIHSRFCFDDLNVVWNAGSFSVASGHVLVSLGVSKSIWAYLDVLGRIWTNLGVSRWVQTCLDQLGPVQAHTSSSRTGE